jgi:short-subunit dehydrogenase
MGSEFANRYGPWAVVAGASEGIGAAFSRRLAAQGVNVVLVARREGPLATLELELRAEFGVDTRVVALDLSTAGAEEALFEATAGLDVGFLVYNAGADENGAFFLDVAPEVWAAMVHRNCVVPLLATHHYAAAMAERGRGGVILVTSGAAWAGGTRLATYAGTKAFDLVFGESLWAELGPRGVDVLSLVVTATDTPAFRRLLEARGREMFDGAADPDDVAREGLEYLGDGPTWSMGMPDGAGPSMLGSLARRAAVEAMSAGSEMTIGPAD